MIKILILSFIYFFIFNSQNCIAQKISDFQFGADQLLTDYFYLIKNKKIGVVTNHTAVLSNEVHLVDALHSRKDIEVTTLFGPEHGIRGNNSAGEKIEHGIDLKTLIPVFSLYGKDRKPTKEMLKNVDVLIFDIQDVGARFYTYISTLFFTIQSAAENNIPVIVLDRPNPINGIYVDGPIRKPELSSFVGIAPLPITHGMTVGELANYFVGEKLIGENLTSDLTIIKMKNWDRKLYYDNFFSSWISPSPNITSLATAIVYPGTCLIEGTNVSEGRGTNGTGNWPFPESPFLTIGAPYINSDNLIAELRKEKIEGVSLHPITFVPKEIPGVANNPKYKNESCNGIRINIFDPEKFESVKFGIKLISTIHKLYPSEFKFRDDSFDRLCGDKSVRSRIINNRGTDEIIKSYQSELDDFKKIRKKYLLY